MSVLVQPMFLVDVWGKTIRVPADELEAFIRICRFNSFDKIVITKEHD